MAESAAKVALCFGSDASDEGDHQERKSDQLAPAAVRDKPYRGENVERVVKDLFESGEVVAEPFAVLPREGPQRKCDQTPWQRLLGRCAAPLVPRAVRC